MAAEEAIRLYNTNLSSPTFIENYGATVFINTYQNAVSLNQCLLTGRGGLYIHINTPISTPCGSFKSVFNRQGWIHCIYSTGELT